jgi:4-hydroxybenzoate polyprenyltransferase
MNPGLAWWKTTRDLLAMIKFSHTLFALPFALLGAALAAFGAESAPRWRDWLGILVCMATARSAAMAFNRLVDRQIDARNPRTAGRHLPAGTLFGYSYAKRFTSLAHVWLGAALMLAPIAAWIALRGDLSWPPVWLGLAVLCWVSGFDILYACQDVEFDRGYGLRSIPTRFGVPASIRLSRVMHVATVIVMALLWRVADLPALYLVGVVIVAVLLAYEQSLVSDDDLSQVKKAFDLNGYVGIVYFAVTALSLMIE